MGPRDGGTPLRPTMPDGVRPGAVRVSQVLHGVALGAVVAVSLAVAHTWPGDAFTGSPVWQVAAPLALAATFSVAVADSRRGPARLARWVVAVCWCVALYWLGSAAAAALAVTGHTGSFGYVLAAAVPAAWWTVVLGGLQACAVVAAQQAGLVATRRWTTRALPAGALLVVAGAVVAPAPPVPSVLPDDLASAAWLQVGSAALVYGWVLLLVVTPAALMVAAARASGTRRRGLARVAVGSVGPFLVVLLCGLLGTLTAAANDLPWGEGVWLTLGFCVALPVTCGWLSATVRELTVPSAASLTSIATVLRVTLWLVYVLGVLQVVPVFSALLGDDAVAGAVAMALTLAATCWPVALVVRWCVRRADPCAAVAAAALAAPPSAGEPDAVRAQRVLREALGDPGARLLLARPGGRWADVAGSPADPASDAVAVDDAGGQPLAVLEHGVRFVDLRALLTTVRPLIERAAWQAELSAQAERVETERARADTAAQEARRRIERDLHDGVQGRLVSLGLALSLARDEASDPLARDLLGRAVAELQGAVAELRELATGALSRRLDGHGLAGAVGDLVARVPVPVDLEIASLALPGAVESTAYFVIAESLTNAVKHADARHIAVRVAGSGGVLTVVVTDDGRGGADVRAGTGLRGLRERVHAAGGRLVVGDRAPRGTVVEAVLPCGS